MPVRTTIHLEPADDAAIKVIRRAHESRGIKMSQSGAIRFAVRETAERLAQTQCEAVKAEARS